MIHTEWICKTFDALSASELYAILQLRDRVFIIEQQCIYQDCDDKDQPSHHLMGWQNGKLVAYSRLIPPGFVYSESSIGRVVNSPSVRGTGIGKELMQKNIEWIYQLYSKVPIKIGAQLYLKKFYESFGFVQTSDVYLEDDIQHILMLLEPK
jgi:ElaA protein